MSEKLSNWMISEAETVEKRFPGEGVQPQWVIDVASDVAKLEVRVDRLQEALDRVLAELVERMTPYEIDANLIAELQDEIERLQGVLRAIVRATTSVTRAGMLARAALAQQEKR